MQSSFFVLSRVWIEVFLEIEKQLDRRRKPNAAMMLPRYHGISYIYVAAVVPTPRLHRVRLSFSLRVRMSAFRSHQQQTALHEPF